MGSGLPMVHCSSPEAGWVKMTLEASLTPVVAWATKPVFGGMKSVTVGFLKSVPSG